MKDELKLPLHICCKGCDNTGSSEIADALCTANKKDNKASARVTRYNTSLLLSLYIVFYQLA